MPSCENTADHFIGDDRTNHVTNILRESGGRVPPYADAIDVARGSWRDEHQSGLGQYDTQSFDVIQRTPEVSIGRILIGICLVGIIAALCIWGVLPK